MGLQCINYNYSQRLAEEVSEKGPPNHMCNPLILETEQRANMLSEKVYFTGR
jgi:hypothetical protein